MSQLSNSCFHQLEWLHEPPYRYRCKLCGKKLKVASGRYPKKEGKDNEPTKAKE